MSQPTPGPAGSTPAGSTPPGSTPGINPTGGSSAGGIHAAGGPVRPTASPGAYPNYEVLPTADVLPVIETAEEVAVLVLAVPGVAQLHAGRFGEVATYLPGRRVTGVKLTDDRVEVHVVVRFGEPLRAVAAHIHAVVAAVVTVPVQVFIEDLTAAHAA